MTHPTDEEREKLENDLLPIVCMLPFLERGHTLNPEMYPKLVDYILNNFVPKAQATPKPAVLGEGELYKTLEQFRIDLYNELSTDKFYAEKAVKLLDEYEQDLASQATAAQERAILKARTDTAVIIRERLANLTTNSPAWRGGVEVANDYIEENEAALASLHQKGKGQG